MFDWSNPETFWLNVTNIALGVATLICCVVLAAGVLQEVVVRLRRRAEVPAKLDDHAFALPKLGLTMADGGEKQDENGKDE
ncbi:hypothetical protein KJ068_15685 [bacterium]|nr:MAG: hypothetical protein EDS67_16445 [candidate division KSB1 bacterium]MCE7942906.1 hypothetical protein [Chlorobi bacterium CHB1]MCL4706611.1 hypothetical protein [bacterium]MDL1873713.1 hypothetical protein [Cytophagia bacterium CHB2]MBC6946809.1 hypothetical protein [candidate division KSB1 bacterium]